MLSECNVWYHCANYDIIRQWHTVSILWHTSTVLRVGPGLLSSLSTVTGASPTGRPGTSHPGCHGDSGSDSDTISSNSTDNTQYCWYFWYYLILHAKVILKWSWLGTDPVYDYSVLPTSLNTANIFNIALYYLTNIHQCYLTLRFHNYTIALARFSFNVA